MQSEEIIKQVKEIMMDVFDVEDLSIGRATTAKDVEEWDSLSHIQLIVAVEKHFKIRFTSSEILNFKNVGEMCDAIQLKLK